MCSDFSSNLKLTQFVAYLKRNDIWAQVSSPISALFEGQQESLVTCTCGHVSQTLETFRELQLPLGETSSRDACLEVGLHCHVTRLSMYEYRERESHPQNSLDGQSRRSMFHSSKFVHNNAVLTTALHLLPIR